MLLAMVHKKFFMAFTSFFPLRKLAAEDLFLEKSALHRILWECHFYSLLYLDVLSLDAYHFCITPLGFIFLITKYKLWCWIDLALGLHIFGFSSSQHQDFLCMSETCVSNIHQEKCFQEIS